MKCVIVAVVLLLAISAVAFSEELAVLANKPDGISPGEQVERYLKQQLYKHIDDRLEAYDQLKSQADCKKWQQQQREFFVRQLGAFPERTPLNARIVGRLNGAGYRIEKILFESRPGLHVSANLYLPVTKPPSPAVLIPCGHSHNGKADDVQQRISILLAKNGMAALCYDPIGQGERYQMLDFENQHSHFVGAPHYPVPHPRVRYPCTSEHTAMGLGCILTGSNIAQYRIWDGMRAIDYLQSRDDIVADKIGCAGNSGGGTMTAYLMALDDRIVAAAPVCYLTTFRRLIDGKGPQDAEQNIFGQIAFGMDEPDYVLMRAPKPTLICNATRDATFNIEGAWDVFRQAKRFYSRLGHAERVEMMEADAVHGYTVQQREAVARWMRRWLLGKDDIVPEVDQLPDPLTDEKIHELSKGDWSERELYCSPEGQVLLMPGEKSVFQLNTVIEAGLRKIRTPRWRGLSDSERRDLGAQVIGAKDDTGSPSLVVDTVGKVRRKDYTIVKLILNPEPGIQLPALGFLPPTPNGKACLYLHGESMKIDAEPGGPIEALVKQGQIVLAAELRAIGETEPGHHRPDWGHGQFGPDVQELLLAYLIGRSYVAMRTEDVAAWARFLATFKTADRRGNELHLVGIGEAAVPALHAAALQPDRFKSVRLLNMVPTWSEIVSAPDNWNQAVNVVHGALKHYDLPDLIELAGPKKVSVERPVDAMGKPVRSRKPVDRAFSTE